MYSSRDVISLLPDEMLSNILSSLPTKHAASTSLLSKRWRNVFNLVQNLDFDDSVLGKIEVAEFPENFESFVDRTLALQSDYHPIKKFSLKCHLGKKNDNQKTCVSRWISKAVERGVMELDLKITDRGLQFMSPQLLSCKTMVKLRLGTELTLHKLPSNVYLPSLKTLFIDTVSFEYGDLSGVLLAGCPVLEDLSIHHNMFPGIPQTISCSTVKRLSMTCDSIADVDTWCPLSFVLPKLIYLDYSHSALSKYPQVNMESLVEAKLNLYRKSFYQISWSPDVTNLIFGIRNVEILHLSSTTVEVIICYCRYNDLVFNNLVKLFFDSRTKRGWKLLPYLLKHSPKLETLILQNLNDDICDNVSMQLNKVKVLHIVSYYGTDEELRHLKSLLWKTESLELVQLDLTAKDDDGTILQQTKRHLMMRLGVTLPSNCQIEVSHKLVM